MGPTKVRLMFWLARTICMLVAGMALACGVHPQPVTSPIPAPSDAAAALPPGPPSGPHDATAHHSFADVDRWRAVFDDPARDAWQKPAELVRALGLRPGACVADVGAGTGYLSRYLAAAVGPTGTVLAIEVEPNLVTHLRTRAESEHTPNVTPVLGSTDNPRLPRGGVDVILFVDSYHHIDDRLAYLRRLQPALRPRGRIVIVDWHKRELPVGPDPGHKLAREHVVAEMTEAGYRLRDEYPDLLPYQYVLGFGTR